VKIRDLSVTSNTLVELGSDQDVVVGQKRKLETPIVENQVRRSARKNKYDGFKPKGPSDVKTTKSKVKPRLVPAIVECKVNEDIDIGQGCVLNPAPPSTPISTIQAIGINLCGVHPFKLSPKKLLKNPLDEVKKPRGKEDKKTSCRLLRNGLFCAGILGVLMLDLNN
jgi:hypothetical protein